MSQIDVNKIDWLKKVDLEKQSNLKIELKIVREGDKIMILYGENLQTGVAGFGDNIPEALRDFANSWENIRGNENSL